MRIVERRWDWRFRAAPAALWPVLADTARFNEAAGLPRYAATDLPQTDGGVRRIGAARVLGLTLSWEEGVPQWVAGRHFAHERRFASAKRPSSPQAAASARSRHRGPSVRRDPAVMTVLENLGAVAESAVVKGFPEPVALRRVMTPVCRPLRI